MVGPRAAAANARPPRVPLGLFDRLLAERRIEAALRLVESNAAAVDAAAFVSLLRACGRVKDLALGTRVAAAMTKDLRKARDPYVSNWVVQMYGSCGSCGGAKAAFEAARERNVFTWTMLLVAFAHNGHLREAKGVFDKMPGRNLVAWTGLLVGYRELGEHREAMQLLRVVHVDGIRPDAVCLLCMLEACDDLVDGIQIHQTIIDSKMPLSTNLSTALIKMYSRFKRLVEAQQVFDDSSTPRQVAHWSALSIAYAQNGQFEHSAWLFAKMPQRDLVSWNSMISWCAHNGQSSQALVFLDQFFEQDEIMGDKFTLLAGIEACCQSLDLEHGIQIHARYFAGLCRDETIVGSALIAMYSRCGCIERAKQVFNAMPARDVVTWTSMIAALGHSGCPRGAFAVFQTMDVEGICPNRVTFMEAIGACGELGHRPAEIVHAEAVDAGLFTADVMVGSSVVAMYAKLGLVDHAQRAFDQMPHRNVVSWTALIAAHGRSGSVEGVETALAFLASMAGDGVDPSSVTFVTVLTMCSHAGMLQQCCHCFVTFVQDYGLVANLDHYACIMDALSRSGRLGAAEDLARSLGTCSKTLLSSNFGIFM